MFPLVNKLSQVYLRFARRRAKGHTDTRELLIRHYVASDS